MYNGKAVLKTVQSPCYNKTLFDNDIIVITTYMVQTHNMYTTQAILYSIEEVSKVHTGFPLKINISRTDNPVKNLIISDYNGTNNEIKRSK